MKDFSKASFPAVFDGALSNELTFENVYLVEWLKV